MGSLYRNEVSWGYSSARNNPAAEKYFDMSTGEPTNALEYVKVQDLKRTKPIVIPVWEKDLYLKSSNKFDEIPSEAGKTYGMIWSKDGESYSVVPYDDVMDYRGDEWGVAGLDQTSVKFRDNSGRSGTFDIGNVTKYDNADRVISGFAEVPEDVLDLDALPDDIQAEIDQLSQGSYEEDPMIAEAKALDDEYRAKQQGALAGLGERTLGQRTVADEMGEAANLELSKRLGQEMGGPNELAALRGYRDAAAGITGGVAGDVVKQRAGQTQALFGGYGNLAGRNLERFALDTDRSLARSKDALTREQLIQEYQNIASGHGTGRLQVATQAALDKEEADRASLNMPSSSATDFYTDIAAAGTSAFGTGLGLIGQAYDRVKGRQDHDQSSAIAKLVTDYDRDNAADRYLKKLA